jgi:hypothetical protein
MTSDNPVLLGLTLYPVPILAVVSALGGCFYATRSLRRFRQAGSPAPAQLDRQKLEV